MNTRKVIYFLEVLRSSTSGYEDVLNRLYQNAIIDDPDISRLICNLNDHVFFKGIGNSLHEKGKTLLDKLYTHPSEALSTIQSICQANELIEHEAEFCKKMMHAAEPFTDTITVLAKKDIELYLNVMKQIASVSTYLIAVYSGMKELKNLFWVDKAGIQEYVYAVNTKFIPALCSVERPKYSWIITKKTLGGGALFGGEGFFISYESHEYVKTLCNGLHKEPIGTHAFLNIRAFESGETEVPYCWGTGNIVSVSPNEGLSLLQGGVVTKLRAPEQRELASGINTPIECIRKLAGGSQFCITPDDLVMAMNQWQMGHEIYMRKQNKICLFCGEKLKSSNLVCPSHFNSELR